mmetsp:Transcript_14184/g.32379  ORF Transcript_14184/g.32379 Transcript_14184/m.32379 type:complete len:283 (-) Transcript_14184:566-1414(-)
MRLISPSLLGTLTGTYSLSSSLLMVDSATVIACRFSLESPRRTGLFSPPARTTSRPRKMESAEPRRLSRLLLLRLPCMRSTASPLASSTSATPSMKARIIVISSVRTSYCNQRRYASATTALHASSGSVNLQIISATVWLVKNSHTPSDATTMNLSSSVTSLHKSSGSAKTPMVSATESPIERVKAQPGKLLPGAHTRGGSPPLSSSSPSATFQFSWYSTMPSSWSQLMITAPAALTRSRSSCRYGVWSMESEYAITRLPFFSPITARESPIFATKTSVPLK